MLDGVAREGLLRRIWYARERRWQPPALLHWAAARRLELHCEATVPGELVTATLSDGRGFMVGAVAEAPEDGPAVVVSVSTPGPPLVVRSCELQNVSVLRRVVADGVDQLACPIPHAEEYLNSAFYEVLVPRWRVALGWLAHLLPGRRRYADGD